MIAIKLVTLKDAAKLELLLIKLKSVGWTLKSGSQHSVIKSTDIIVIKL
jgi:hypothetical protein